MKKHIILLAGLALPVGLTAQVPDAATATPAPQAQEQQQAPRQESAGGGDGGFFGGALPVFDPGTETITWDGRTWHVHNNRVFQARFEKFLNAPEQDSEADEAYDAIMVEILNKLHPTQVSPRSLDEAFRLLPRASEYDADAHLGDALANQVHSAWTAMQARDRLAAANTALEDERKRLEWNAQMTARGESLSPAPRADNRGEVREWQREQRLRRETRMAPITTRLAEVNANMKANQLKREVSELQTKIEFQALIVQLFLQRRFQHVLIGTRFYRAIFSDGDSQLRVGDDSRDLFARTTGMPPTVGTIDSMASEIMRDVREGVNAFQFLLEREELESATKRLAETFIIGEYMPEVRTLPRDKKRQALAFAQKANQLLSALEVKDYTRAETLVDELEEMAKDFDSSRALAAIETAKTVAAMHIAKAKNAAAGGDRETLEEELRAATEIWPRNPALAEVSGMIFSQADVQQRALVDFDQLLSQRNYRQIYDDRVRFIAATSLHPERAQQLQEVLENMALVESAIIRAQEIEKRGDYIGAWESTERAFLEFPDDNKLNQVRTSLTTQAADFVRALRTAEEMERRQQPGSSLAWYLNAQNQYPPSEFAREGIERMIEVILPDAS